jgi:hypothetical protein
MYFCSVALLTLSLSLSLSLLVTFGLPHQFEIHSTILLKSYKRGLCCSLTSIYNKTNMASALSFSSVTVSRVACEFNFNETPRQPVHLFAQPAFILYAICQLQANEYRLSIHRNTAWF